MMRQPQLFNLNTIVADGLKEVKLLKNLVCRLQQYEDIARLRDIEKTFLQLEEELSKGLFPVLTDTITENTKEYFEKVFLYGCTQEWKDISRNLQLALTNRKEQLNKLFRFPKANFSQFTVLDKKLLNLQNQLMEFVNMKAAFAELPSLQSIVTRVHPGAVTLSFYAEGRIYYQYEQDISVLAEDLINLIEDVNPEYRKMRDVVQNDLLPKSFRIIICPLFILLVGKGFLAWEDFIGVSDVTLNIDIAYEMTYPGRFYRPF